MKKTKKQALRPAQHQKRRPGKQSRMEPQTQSDGNNYIGCGLLTNKVAIITGADSGIGRATAVAFAKEGADIVFDYLSEQEDANKTKELIENAGRSCIAVRGDLTQANHRKALVNKALKAFGRIDILVNNAALHYPAEDVDELQWKNVEHTFAVNIFAPIQLTKLVVPHLKSGASIINTTSVVAFRGSKHLLDYAATKGALIAWTRSLALALVDKGIRVNAVAPGPIWTPLIPSSFPAQEVAEFGSQTPLKRAGQPDEVAPAYVLLASERGSYIVGQCIHVNGGEIVNA